MGGWTKVMLKDTSRDNIDRHNARLEIFGVPKQYRYQHHGNVVEEYEWYLAHVSEPDHPNSKVREAVYPEHMYPRDQINSFADFCKFWNPEAVGASLVPPNGALTFDCYYSRMSRRAMRAVAKYLLANVAEIASVEGSFSTFMEKGMTASQRAEFLENCAPAIRREG
jgi:hypothetical protein